MRKSREIIEKLRECKLEVVVSSIEGEEKAQPISALIAKAKELNKAVIFTFTPGPFKPADPLPKNWMDTTLAKGCTPQLDAFESEAKNLNAFIYAVNKHTSEYQCGAEGLLAKKKLPNLKMISDANGAIEETLKLDTIYLGSQHYFERFSVVFTPDGQGKIFEIESPVDPVKAKAHVADIAKFIVPRLAIQAECTESETFGM